jgi:phage major head subunit gpT-like protein
MPFTTASDLSPKLLEGVVRTEFFRAYNELRASDWQRFTTVVSSGAAEEYYDWLRLVGDVREWIGDRVINQGVSQRYSIRNKTWEFGFYLERSAVEDDQSGQIGLAITAAAQRAAEHQGRLVSEVLEAGFDDACYDGVAFFSDSHPLDDGTTFSNLTDALLDAEAVQDGLETLMGAKRNDGAPWGNHVGPERTILMVPPALYFSALELTQHPFYDAGSAANNPLAGLFEVALNPYLSSDSAWYLLMTTEPLKPLVFQQRTELELTAQTDPATGDVVFRNDLYAFGTRQRYNAGYTFPQLAYASDGSGS